MDLQELLAFVDECDVGDAEHHQQQQASTDSTPGALHSSENNGSDSEEKEPRTRPRRDVVEIAALQAQAAALALELQRVKQDRAVAGATSALLLTAASHWVSETDLQSRLRAAAQEENERLRAKMHEQMLIAKRLINVLKRNSASHVMQTLERLERDATLRAEKVDDDLVDLDRVYHQTDAVLADAGMSRLPPTSFDARIRQQFDREGFFVEIRRRICVARDHHTTSEAYWQFSPHPSFSKRFIFEQTESLLDETRGHNFVFQSKQGTSRTRFLGQYLMRRYKTEERVVVVWKMLIETEGSSPLLRLCGRGWSAIYGSNADGEHAVSPSVPFTSVQAVARYFPESNLGAGLNPDQILQDEDLRTLIDFVTYGSEGYSAFSAQMAPKEQ